MIEFHDERSEQDLAQPREKPVSIAASSLYRFTRFSRPFVGRGRLLRWYLDLGRLFQRLSFEVAGEIFGESFHSRRTGVSPERIQGLLPKGASVLDVGCGSGRWCAVAAAYADHVTGLDASAASIENARRMHPHPKIEFLLADAEKNLRAQLGHRTFDLVLLIHVIEHIEKVDQLLEELKLLGRKLLVEVPDFESDMLNHVRHHYRRPFYSDADHVREYTDSILRSQLTRSGWRVEHLEIRRGSIVAVAGHPR